MSTGFHYIPTTMEEAARRGFNELDVIIVSADAYVDHPAFAASIIGRYLESLGVRVGIIPQPDWHSTKDFTVLGRPRLFFGVTAGNLDSMVSLYTAQRKIRSDDPYSEEGTPGKRPYLPCIVYTNRLKEAFKGVAVIIGGIEASLRRVAHYDFYTDTVRPSLLLDAKADMLVYGNGEAPLREIVRRLKEGIPLNAIRDVRGTAVPVGQKEKGSLQGAVILPSLEKVRTDKHAFNGMTRSVVNNLNPSAASPLYQETGSRGVYVNPPPFPLAARELDFIYGLPFTRMPHPRYRGKIPALKVVEESITSHRGCYGGCRFCSIYLHQGKSIQSRSADSVEKEAAHLAEKKGGKIVITDIGGPTANMYGTFCRDKNAEKTCRRISCLYPFRCKNLEISSREYHRLLKRVREYPRVGKVFVSSGVRYDLALLNPEFTSELAEQYTPGQLSVAPEHCSDDVLQVMGKPPIEVYNEFARAFNRKSAKARKKHYLLPYFIVGHPGADERSENALRDFVRSHGITVEQVQEFYPTPMTISTAMYYTEMDVFTGKKINVEKKLGVKKKWKKAVVR